MARREWIRAGLPEGAYEALARELPASRLWSLLLDLVEARAASRDLAALGDQWQRDRFVQPALADQRTSADIDRQLLRAAAAFEAIELSPVAPLGVCSLMARTSQNRVLSALRGTEVVSDPTNVMALECARRLRRDGRSIVRLATSHRCVRTQDVPRLPGRAAHFRIFCLASAGVERKDHAFAVEAVAEHVMVMLDGLDRLEANGFTLPKRRVTVLATERRRELGERIAAAVGVGDVARNGLEHPYYDGGVRYQIVVRGRDGADVPLVDGGIFEWVAKAISNRRAVFVASGLGSQLVAATCARRRTPSRARKPG